MGKIGHGYGSEWHLLRYLGYHRNEFFNRIEAVTAGGKVVDWLDHPFDAARPFLDREWKGVDFLGTDHPAYLQWRAFWPQTGNVQNWDAVGLLDRDGVLQWLLVEAKAHLREVECDCAAKEVGGLPAIRSALEQTKAAAGAAAVPIERWLNGHYQHANRLAALHFLTQHQVPARLLDIYFLGDCHPHGDCPATTQQWQPILDRMERHLGIDPATPLLQRTHKLFLHVCPTAPPIAG